MRLHPSRFINDPARAYAGIISQQWQLAFRHSHDYFECFVVHRGTAVHRINGGSRTLTKGTVVLVRPDDLHYYADMSPDFAIINVLIPSGTIRTLFDYLGTGYDSRRLLSSRYPPTTQPAMTERTSFRPRGSACITCAPENDGTYAPRDQREEVRRHEKKKLSPGPNRDRKRRPPDEQEEEVMEFNSTLVLIVLGVYLAFMLYLGFYFKNRTSSFADFILGNRGIPWFVIAMTMLATLANAQQTLGIAGTSYALGFSPMIWFFLLVNIFIYPLLVRLGSRYRYLNFQTIVDLAEARYPGSGRNTVLLSVWQIAWGVVSTAICFFGGALVIETIFNVPMWLGIVIVGVITVFYCMMGGLNGVVFTDTIQWLIIILGTAFLVPSVFAKFGTFSEFFRAVLGNSGFAPAEGAAVWPGYTDLFTLPGFAGVTPISLIAMGLAGSLWIPIDLGFMQRMLAAKDPREGRRAGLGFLLIVTLWACIMVGMGVMAGQIMPGVKVTDSVILRMANLAMPGIGVAIFVTAIAAAVMSTVSTYLNATAAIITKNIYKRFINKKADDKTMVRVVRIMTPVVAVAALCFAPFVRNAGVFATAITAQIVLCAAVAPLILLSTYWKRMTEAAAFWGCLVSGVVTLGLVFYSGGGTAVFYGAGIGGVPAIFIGLAIGFVIYLVASLLKPYDREAVGPVFREIFESTQKPARVRNTDLFVIGAAIVLVIVAILVKTSSDVKVAWPPLSGAGGTITDIVFYVLAAGLSLISIYILARTIGWVRSLKKGK